MATYREFREQAKRRRRKRALRRMLVFVLAVLVILGLAFLITRLMKGGAPDGASGSSAAQSVSQPQSAASAPESGGAASQAPAPAQDPGDTSWNQMGPVEQTLNYSVNNPDYRLIALPENGVVDYTYFDRAVLIGDSVSQGWNIYESPMKAHAFVCAYKSIGPSAIVNKQTLDPGQGSGRGQEVGFDTIVNSQPKRMYILLGANALVRDGEAVEQSFLAYYSQMLDMFREAVGGEVKIYVESVTPVRPGVSQPGLYKERIERVNNQLAALAQEKGCYFVNLYEALADENGDLRAELAAADGVHLKAEAYTVMAEYLARHTAYAADNPYLPGSPYYKGE